MIYYHATLVNDWLAKVQQTGVWVHLGTREAAEHRTMRVTRQGLVRVQPYYLHTVEVTEPIRAVSLDMDDGWSDTYEVGPIAYINHHEDPGSTSLLVAPHHIKIIETEILPCTQFQSTVA